MACSRGCCETQRQHWLSISISAHALPNKGKGVIAIDKKEGCWDKDMPAYKRLRKAGLQPKSIDGSANLEAKAVDRREIEWGHLLNKEQIKQAEEGIALVNGM